MSVTFEKRQIVSSTELVRSFKNMKASFRWGIFLYLNAMPQRLC